MKTPDLKFSEKFWSFLKKSPLVDVTKFLLVIAALTWLMARGTERLGYNWQWYRVPQYIFSFENGDFVAGPLLHGLMVTLRITAVSLVFSFVLGLATSLFRLSNSIVARGLARGYLECIRNTPLLVQLFFIYFVLAPILDVSRFASAVLALSLFEGAYASEIFRAGIVSIHRGQWEAAHSLGLTAFHNYRYIILPQAIRRILPPLTNQAISLVKDSALVSTIAIYDLTMQGRAIIAETYLTFEIWFTIAAIYLLVTISLSLVVNTMEKRLRVAT
ncbi:MAG: amino acid ABC transporter permease [Desulfobacteraceae bacterium]|jgi:polar amino acid transport system permease protein